MLHVQPAYQSKHEREEIYAQDELFIPVEQIYNAATEQLTYNFNSAHNLFHQLYPRHVNLGVTAVPRLSSRIKTQADNSSRT